MKTQVRIFGTDDQAGINECLANEKLAGAGVHMVGPSLLRKGRVIVFVETDMKDGVAKPKYGLQKGTLVGTLNEELSKIQHNIAATNVELRYYKSSPDTGTVQARTEKKLKIAQQEKQVENWRRQVELYTQFLAEIDSGEYKI